MIVGIHTISPSFRPAFGLDPMTAASLINAGLNFIEGDSGKAQAALVLQQQAAARREIYIGGGVVLGAAVLALVVMKRR